MSVQNIIHTRFKWEDTELYSIGKRNYFSCAGTIYMLSEQELTQALEETKDMPPKYRSAYLVEQVLNNKFTKIS